VGGRQPLGHLSEDAAHALGLEIGISWSANNPYAGNLGKGYRKDQISPMITPLFVF
jgi:hypothetical protein